MPSSLVTRVWPIHTPTSMTNIFLVCYKNLDALPRGYRKSHSGPITIELARTVEGSPGVVFGYCLGGKYIPDRILLFIFALLDPKAPQSFTHWSHDFDYLETHYRYILTLQHRGPKLNITLGLDNLTCNSIKLR